jgi:predicted RNA-binding protein
MCLSNVYTVEAGKDTLVAEYVSKIIVGNGTVKLTDVMGEETEVSGVLMSVDLIKNIIRIDASVK